MARGMRHQYSQPIGPQITIARRTGRTVRVSDHSPSLSMSTTVKAGSRRAARGIGKAEANVYKHSPSTNSKVVGAVVAGAAAGYVGHRVYQHFHASRHYHTEGGMQ